MPLASSMKPTFASQGCVIRLNGQRRQTITSLRDTERVSIEGGLVYYDGEEVKKSRPVPHRRIVVRGSTDVLAWCVRHTICIASEWLDRRVASSTSLMSAPNVSVNVDRHQGLVDCMPSNAVRPRSDRLVTPKSLMPHGTIPAK